MTILHPLPTVGIHDSGIVRDRGFGFKECSSGSQHSSSARHTIIIPIPFINPILSITRKPPTPQTPAQNISIHNHLRTSSQTPLHPRKPSSEQKQVTLTAEPIKCPPLAFERIHNIERSYRLALRMFGISDGIPDDGFEESFEDAAGFFVDHCLRSSVIIPFLDKAHRSRLVREDMGKDGG